MHLRSAARLLKDIIYEEAWTLDMHAVANRFVGEYIWVSSRRVESSETISRMSSLDYQYRTVNYRRTWWSKISLEWRHTSTPIDSINMTLATRPTAARIVEKRLFSSRDRPRTHQQQRRKIANVLILAADQWHTKYIPLIPYVMDWAEKAAIQDIVMPVAPLSSLAASNRIS